MWPQEPNIASFVHNQRKPEMEKNNNSSLRAEFTGNVGRQCSFLCL